MINWFTVLVSMLFSVALPHFFVKICVTSRNFNVTCRIVIMVKYRINVGRILKDIKGGMSVFRNIKVLEKALDATLLKNHVITHNIANIDTPGYKRYTVSFEEQLEEAIKKEKSNGQASSINRAGHKISDPLDDVIPKVLQVRTTKMRPDGNNVDIDVEMSELAKNVIVYNALVQKISKEFEKIKMVIQEGRR